MIKCNILEFCHDCPRFNAETLTEQTQLGFVPTTPNFIVQCEHYSLCQKISEMIAEKYSLKGGDSNESITDK